VRLGYEVFEYPWSILGIGDALFLVGLLPKQKGLVH
jgi:hypothetical protein